jgi:hypothetical protein
MKRSPMPPRKSRKPRVNRQRKSKNWIRAYGSPERVNWIQRQRCVVWWGACSSGLCHNHHIITGGKGRKADANRIVPLCRSHHDLLHAKGRQYFEEYYDLDLDALAKSTDAAWRAHLAEDAA